MADLLERADDRVAAPPPPGLRGLTLRIELVRNPQLITFRPLTTTVKSTETSGTIAMTKVE